MYPTYVYIQFNIHSTSALTLEICAGVSQDYTEADQAARTTFTCQYVPANANGEGSTTIDLMVTDPARAVSVSGRVRPVGLCSESSVDTNNLYVVLLQPFSIYREEIHTTARLLFCYPRENIDMH